MATTRADLRAKRWCMVMSHTHTRTHARTRARTHTHTHTHAHTHTQVMKRCKEANPRHGEVWQRVVKQPGANLTEVEQKLLEVVKAVADR